MSLAEISVCGSVLILVGAVLRLRLPKDACMVLWWGAAVRLLLPCSLPFRWSVYTFLKALAAAKSTPLPPAAPPVIYLPPAEGFPVTPVMPVLPALTPEPEPFPLRTVLWLAGAFLLGCWFAASYFRWRRRFREALPVDSDFVRQWRGDRPLIRVRVSDQIDAPLTYGVFRPVILLPKNFPIHDETALLCVLTHERVHIQRLDGLLKLLLASALCVHWFNPAVWLLWVLAGRDMELRCDQAALSSLGPERKAAYALTLLRMAELRNASMPLSSSFCRCGLEERILAVMKFKKTSLLTLTAALALTLCVTAVFATTAWTKPASDPNKAGTMSEAMLALRSLEDSIQFEDGTFHFTIPSGKTGGNRWNIWISGRVLTAADEDSGMIMSVHYLENESEKGEWVSGKTYSFQTADAAYSELTMSASLGDEEISVDLTPFLPDNLAPLKVPELPESKENIPEGAEMVWPVDDWSSVVGSFNPTSKDSKTPVHNGVDFGGLDSGAPVYAAMAGTVKATGFDKNAGNYVLLDHGNGVETYYSACQKVLVKNGETVRLGQTIASVGQSGMATGPHLHFEIRKDGVPQNPLDCLSAVPLNPDQPATQTSGPVNADRNGMDAAQNRPEDPAASPSASSVTITTPSGEQIVSVGEDPNANIKLNSGDPVYAAGDGTVKDTGSDSKHGNYILLDHGDGLESYYSGCGSVLVRTGDTVKGGQYIAAMGNTGTHLHFEIRKDGVTQNPFDYSMDSSCKLDYASHNFIPSKQGESFYAPMPGTVIHVVPSRCGYLELVMDYDGKIYTYNNCDTIAVKPGDKVQQDDLLGTVKGPMSLGSGSTTEDYLRRINQSAKEGLVNGDYPRTKNGLTYAKDTSLAAVVGYQPDLVFCTADNGREGYVFLKEQNDIFMNQTKLKAGQSASIPVYDLDGNVIGKYTIAALDPSRNVSSTYQSKDGKTDITITANSANIKNDPAVKHLAEEWLVDGDYPRNKNGQTYAPNESLTAVVGYPPDLVSGIATNGQKGYISLKELNTDTRVMWGIRKALTDLDADKDRSIPVYDEAGDVIGEFIINAGAASSD